MKKIKIGSTYEKQKFVLLTILPVKNIQVVNREGKQPG